MIQRKCKKCGKDFNVYPSSKQIFCSRECAIIENWTKRERARKVSVVCLNCKKEFEVNASDIRVKRGEIKYCSTKCRDEGLKRGKEIPCKQCGKLFYSTRREFCSRECVYLYRSSNSIHKIYQENGYLVKFQNGYNKKGNVKLHRAIMEEALGRRLKPNEIVHHKDGNKQNNDISNLEVMERRDHSRLHRLKELESGKKLFGRVN